jgi:hypothetical protein
MNAPSKDKEIRSLSDLHMVVREALSESLGGEVTGPLLLAHPCDPQGRNWDASGRTPPQHRALIDGLRDRYTAS